MSRVSSAAAMQSVLKLTQMKFAPSFEFATTPCAVPLFMKSPSPSCRTSSLFGSSARSSPLVISRSSGSRWR